MIIGKWYKVTQVTAVGEQNNKVKNIRKVHLDSSGKTVLRFAV